MSVALLTVWLNVVDDWPNANVAIKSTIMLAIAPIIFEFLIKAMLEGATTQLTAWR